MTSRESVLLISDACVLIDYCKAECHDIISLISRHYLPIKVPFPVLKEVNQLTYDEAAKLGIGLLEVTLEQMREANTRGGPSQQDRLCFIAARDINGAVWSNDRQLRKICKEHGIQVYWGLEMLLIMIKLGHLKEKRARDAAIRIHKIDPHYITETVLNHFMKNLEIS